LDKAFKCFFAPSDHPSLGAFSYTLKVKMRLTKKDIHPSVFDAAKRLITEGMNNPSPSSQPYSDHLNVWMAEYWKGLVGYLASLPAALILITTLNPSNEATPITKIASVAVIVGWIALGVYLHKKNSEQITPKELQALKDVLGLSANGKLYIDCVLKVLSSKILDQVQQKEWMQSLWQTMDYSAKIEALISQGKEGMRGSNSADEDIRRLESKIESTTDPIARQTYEQSLDITKRLMSNTPTKDQTLERAEAQLELISQTLLETRDSLGSLQEPNIPPEPGFGVAELRANLSKVQFDSQEILRAVGEVQSV
jgi:hypothetical protein